MSVSVLLREVVDVPTLLEDASQSEMSTTGRMSQCAPIRAFYQADAAKLSIAHAPEHKFTLGRYYLPESGVKRLQLGGVHHIINAVAFEVPEKAFLPYTVSSGQPYTNHFATIEDAKAEGPEVAAFPGDLLPTSEDCIVMHRSTAGLITTAVPPVPNEVQGQRAFANGRAGFAEANVWCDVEEVPPVIADNGYTPFSEPLVHWDRSTPCTAHALKGTLEWVLVYSYVANDWDGEESAAYGAAFKKQPSEPVLATPVCEVFGRDSERVCDSEHVVVSNVKEHLVVKAHSDKYAAFLRVKSETPRDYVLSKAAIHVVKVAIQAGFTVLDPVVRLQLSFETAPGYEGEMPILPMVGLLQHDLDVNLNGENERILPTVPRDTVGLGCTACLYWGRSRFETSVQ